MAAANYRHSHFAFRVESYISRPLLELMIDFYPTFNTISLRGIDVLYDELLEAISKGAPLKVKIDASSSLLEMSFGPMSF